MAVEYFLRIAGLVGNSEDPDHDRNDGWFTIDSYELDHIGGSSKKPVFSPLMVDFKGLPAEMIPVVKSAIQGKHFSEIEIDVADFDLGSNPINIKLGNAAVTGFVQKAGGYDGTNLDTVMAFSFTNISETIDTNENIGKYTSKLVSVAGPKLGDLTALFDEISDPEKVFKLHVDKINGDSTLEPFANWFDVDTFDFGATMKGNGKPAFTDLHIDLKDTKHGVADLLMASTTSKHIANMELQLNDFLGIAQHPTYDLKLENVLVKEVHQKNGDTDISLSFSKMTMTIWSDDHEEDYFSQTFTYDLKSGKTARQHKALSDLDDLKFDDGGRDGHKHAGHRETIALEHHGRFDASDQHGHGGLFDL